MAKVKFQRSKRQEEIQSRDKELQTDFFEQIKAGKSLNELLPPPQVTSALPQSQQILLASQGQSRQVRQPVKVEEPEPDPRDQRTLVVALVGAPNAGKSTLLNSIIGTKVSIVSPKVQTTRERVVGVLTEGATQLLFYDTPGIAPRKFRAKMIRPMAATAWQTTSEADMVLIVVDAARRLNENVADIVRGINQRAQLDPDEVQQRRKQDPRDELKALTPAQAAKEADAERKRKQSENRELVDLMQSAEKLGVIVSDKVPAGFKDPSRGFKRSPRSALAAAEAAALQSDSEDSDRDREPSDDDGSDSHESDSGTGTATDDATDTDDTDETDDTDTDDDSDSDYDTDTGSDRNGSDFEGDLSLEDENALFRDLRNKAFRPVIVLNKVDLVNVKAKLLPLADELSKLCDADEVFMVSSTERDGTDDVKKYLIKNAERKPWMFERHEVTDQSDLTRAEEIVREKIYQRLNQEVPYVVRQHTESWSVYKNGSLRIDQILYVRSESQRAMVIGKKAAVIQQVGTDARLDLEALFKRRVHLYLRVVVKK
eukprot:TRINITY_DN4826_c0_g1_i1.p1 TRINITY_DN4826_c0_g1~~TRINITY_DN4826_c0_g1_i1.p1  ORF type:complete len:589 (-),score=138.88 TRINITY_DN4826_c0_g1_i1:20-1645(-)